LDLAKTGAAAVRSAGIDPVVLRPSKERVGKGMIAAHQVKTIVVAIFEMGRFEGALDEGAVIDDEGCACEFAAGGGALHEEACELDPVAVAAGADRMTQLAGEVKCGAICEGDVAIGATQGEERLLTAVAADSREAGRTTVPREPTCSRPFPVKIAPVAVNWTLFACCTTPPHGCPGFWGMNITGRSTVPLIVIVPLLVMLTPEATRTMLPAPTVRLPPAATVRSAPIWMRESAGQATAPLKMPPTGVQEVVASI